MRTFHEAFPKVALELKVTRHPFSFLGDADGAALDALTLKREGTWKDRLLDYCGGNPHVRDQAMAGMCTAGTPWVPTGAGKVTLHYGTAP